MRFERCARERGTAAAAAAALAVCVLLCACSPSREPTPGVQAPEPVVPPRRIVSLAPALTELLFALGAGPQVVGVTRFCDYPPEARQLPRVGGYLDPSAEAIVALRPDLVAAAPSPGNRRPVLALERLGLDVLVVPDRTLADLRVATQRLGLRLGRVQEAGALLAALQQDMDAVVARVRGAASPKVLLVYGHRPLVAGCPTSFGGELLALLGGRNVCAGSQAYPLFSMERVLAQAPQVILDASMETVGAVEQPWLRWASLPAVGSGRIHRMSSRLQRPGPRIAEALEEMARALYPARWATHPGASP